MVELFIASHSGKVKLHSTVYAQQDSQLSRSLEMSVPTQLGNDQDDEVISFPAIGFKCKPSSI